LSYGELITVELINCFLYDLNIKAVVLPSLEIIKLNENNNPDFPFVQNKLNFHLDQNVDNLLFIMQGFICLNHNEEIDNLKRGGSDYTATIVGSACNAEEVEIWSDIDGLHNNDPRHVSSTRAVDRLSYEEAEELAYFGAKVLHPTCIYPVKKKQIPVFLKNTMNPSAEGTHIYNFEKSDGIKAIAAKDGIVAIKIHSGRMLQAYGFLKKIFEVFEHYKTPVDMITTSEVSVSVTIDNPSCLNQIVRELLELGSVDVFPEQSIICVVGNFKSDEKGIVSEVLKSIDHIPVRMLSYGASENNLTMLIGKSDKKEVLCSLHKKLFRNQLIPELI
jgi:aspartate kinase